MDPRRRIFIPILEECAAVEDTDTHHITCAIGGIHLAFQPRETPPFSGRVASSPFSKIRGANKPCGPDENFDCGGTKIMLVEDEAGWRRRKF